MATFDSITGGLAAACLSTFGEQVTYQPNPPLGAAFTLTAARRTPREREPAAEGSYIVLFVRLTDFPAGAPANGDQVTVKGVAYKVYAIDNDGHGGAELTLRKI
jgi:hypothetical protein